MSGWAVWLEVEWELRFGFRVVGAGVGVGVGVGVEVGRVETDARTLFRGRVCLGSRHEGCEGGVWVVNERTLF